MDQVFSFIFIVPFTFINNEFNCLIIGANGYPVLAEYIYFLINYKQFN